MDKLLTKKIKICGIKRKEDIFYVNACMPDYIGFVFAKSKRNVTLHQAKQLKKELDKKIISVGVFANQEIDVISRAVNEGIIQMIQLHGEESWREIETMKELFNIPIIKAVPVTELNSIIKVQNIPCDYLLFDSGTGGTGKTFSWKILEQIKNIQLMKPFFLAGGLNVGNIRKASRYGAFCLDVSSGVESNGVKDYEKIREIIEIIKNENE